MARTKNMGTATVKFNEGAVITGIALEPAAEETEYALIVTGSSIITDEDIRLRLDADTNSHPGFELAENGTRKWIIYNSYTDDSLRFKAASDLVTFQSDGDVIITGDLYLGPDTADTTRIYHNGNTDTHIDIYSNDSVEFIIGGLNYLKLKEGAEDWVGFNKNNVDIDFKLWGTNDSNPAIYLDAGNESLLFNAAVKANVTETSSFPYTVAARDYLIACAGSGARTINLPAVSGQTGRILIIKDSNGSSAAGSITLDGDSSEQIDGSTTYVISHNKEAVTIMCDGVGWAITSRVRP